MNHALLAILRSANVRLFQAWRLATAIVGTLLGVAAANADGAEGLYQGSWKTNQEISGQVYVPLIGKDDGRYEGRCTVHRNGTSWYEFKVWGETTRDKVTVSGVHLLGKAPGSRVEWQGTITQDRLAGRFTSRDGMRRGAFALTRLVRSPTLGVKPPKGAIVLFDGKNLDAWRHWSLDDDLFWTIKEGDLVADQGNIVTHRKFTDYKLHVEFLIPDVKGVDPEKRKSGVFLHGKYYELQIADSFGADISHSSCGGIYFRLPPRQQVCLPIGHWQTFDITFRAPRLNQQRRVSRPAHVTIALNGITIHDNAEIPDEGVIRDPAFASPAGIVLQDQDFPIRFRNIWAIDLPANESPSK